MIDLRSNIDAVYNQSVTSACFPHSVVNALDCMYDRAGKSKRFSRSHLWAWARFWMGMVGVNSGVTFEAMTRALKDNGAALESDAPWDADIAQGVISGIPVVKGFEFIRSPLTGTQVETIKRLLTLGIPVVCSIHLTPDFDNLATNRDWKTHNISADKSQINGLHAVCIVGFDDDCQRLLVENSWGSEWADGGFFGIPYKSLDAILNQFYHFNAAPVAYVPTEGVTMSVVHGLTMAECAEFVHNTRGVLRDMLISTFTTGGAEALVKECIKWKVSDKHMEMLASWPRGTVRKFREDNPQIAWDGFVWDSL